MNPNAYIRRVVTEKHNFRNYILSFIDELDELLAFNDMLIYFSYKGEDLFVYEKRNEKFRFYMSNNCFFEFALSKNEATIILNKVFQKYYNLENKI